MTNKLGFYLHNFEIGEHKGDLFRAISEIQPPVMLIHAWDQVDQLRRMAPNALIIGRMDYFGQGQRPVRDLLGDWLNPDKGDPESRGRDFAEHILNDNFQAALKRENGRLLIDAWMSLNEPVPGPASPDFRQNPAEIGARLRAYDAFQVGFRDRLIEHGIEAVAFNFGAGNFVTAQDYLKFCPRTLASYTYLGFHEYGWPALSVEVAPTAVSSAGTYRPIVTGIRQVTGREYQVILTEAGLTFMHKYPQSSHDQGWLFVPPPEFGLQPLTQDEYWRSLTWLNNTLNRDSFVRGACLYEVGHHGDWVTFRHFGQDNREQRIWIVDAIRQLAAESREAAAPPTRGIPPQPGVLRGRVINALGEPIGGARVRLIGDRETLGADPHAAANRRGAVTWTRPLTGYAGTLWNCWQAYVAPAVAGITWEEFRHEAAQYNPSLRQSDDRLVAGSTYYLPENRVFADTRGSAPAVLWDRLLSGFAGDLWRCWQLHVQGKVVGVKWEQFQAEMTEHNPGLTSAASPLLAAQTYVLPRNAGQEEYLRVAYSAVNGRFTFDGLAPGAYRIEISAPGYQRTVQTLVLDGDASLAFTLEPVSIEIERGDPFVRAVGQHFAVGGRKFRFVGVNLRGLAHYGLSDPVRSANAADQLQAAREMGARVVRIFLPHAQVSVEETRGRLIALLDLMEKRFSDMYLIVALANLYDDVDFRVPGDKRDPDGGFYTHQPIGEGRKLLSIDWFREGYKVNYRPFVQTILQDPTIRNSPRILAYNIGNELKAESRGDGYNIGHPELLVDFMRTMARQMRQWDGGKHLITTGMISTRHAHMAGNDALRERLYDTPELDFITNHAYHGDDDQATNLDQENAGASREDDSDLAGRLGKPLLIEEAGMEPTPNQRDRSGWVAQDLQRLLDEKQAVGYMPWGFMQGPDNGDGDNKLGLDHIKHEADWHQLRRMLNERSAALAQDAAEIRPPSSVFATGQTIFTQITVNLRDAAGRQAAVVHQVPGRTRVTVAGAPRQRDSMIWWPVSVAMSEGALFGWIAQQDASSGQTLLSLT